MNLRREYCQGKRAAEEQYISVGYTGYLPLMNIEVGSDGRDVPEDVRHIILRTSHCKDFSTCDHLINA